MTSYTFISYEKADATPAGELCALLEEGGLTCWIAPRDIPPGASYAATLYNGVAEASALVLLLSATTNDSPHVLREVELAVSKRPPIPIITVRLDTSDPSPDFKYHLTSLQWIEAAGRPLTDWGAVVARVLVARLGPAIRPADPVEAPVPPEPPVIAPAVVEAPVVEAPVAETPVVKAPAVAAPVVEAPVLVETTPDPEPADDPVPVVAPVVVAERPPPRPRPSAATPQRDRPERKPTSRWSSRPVVVGAIAVLAVAGVGAALALGGGGDSGDKAAAGTTTTASAAAASATTAATSVAEPATTAATTPDATSSTPASALAEHKSDHPKAGWAPTSADALFTFARAPQDGVVRYSYPAIHQTYSVAVHGKDLVISVRDSDPSKDLDRLWMRFSGNRLVNACVRQRAGAHRQRCGTTAAALGVTSASFRDELLNARNGYFDLLTTLPELDALRGDTDVSDVSAEGQDGWPSVCVERRSKNLLLCVQENGFVTKLHVGKDRITATSITPRVVAADMKQPA